jgi:hypothetical protein
MALLAIHQHVLSLVFPLAVHQNKRTGAAQNGFSDDSGHAEHAKLLHHEPRNVCLQECIKSDQ